VNLLSEEPQTYVKGDLTLMFHIYLKKDKQGKIEGVLKISAYKDNFNTRLREKYTSAYTMGMQHIADKLVLPGGIYKLKLEEVDKATTSTENVVSCELKSYNYSYISHCTGGMDNTVCFIVKRIIKRYRCVGGLEDEVEVIDWIEDENGGGWYEYDEEDYEFANQSIIDSLDGYPCAQNILKQLPNVNNLADSILNGVFGINSPVDIVFKPKTNQPYQYNGETVLVNIVNGKFRFDIYIGHHILVNSAQEFILGTMIHECIHAMIQYQYERFINGEITEQQFKNLFPSAWAYMNMGPYSAEHQEMADNYVEKLSQIILSFNPMLGTNNASLLAWRGLGTTNAFGHLSQPMKDSIHQFNAMAKQGNEQNLAANNLKKCD